jgi:DNA polymerase III subunit epsilon
MKLDPRELAAMLAPGAVLLILGLGLGASLAATLDPDERAALAAMLAPRVALVLLGWAMAALVLGALARRAYAVWAVEPVRLAEAAQGLVGGGHDIPPPDGSPACGVGARALAAIGAQLARERDALRADIELQVQAAARGIEQERSRLAALMSELTQSVIVCNLDGRILLYNKRARLQFRELSRAPALEDGAELIGLGRSVYAVFDRQLVEHALEHIRRCLVRGAAQPSTQFVTSTPAGQLLRVQMAPVRDASTTTDDVATLSGFVLMMQNITRQFEEDSAQDRALHSLTEGSRASLGSLQAAVDMLELPDLDAPTRERFLNVVRDEVRSLASRVQSVAASNAEGLKTRWPLENMLGADLVQAALRQFERLPDVRATAGELDESLWLRIDSHGLLQALASLAARLADELAIRRFQLRLRRVGTRAHLDLVWSGTAISTETAMSWEADPMTVGDAASLLSVRDVVERHGGEFWFQRERTRHESYFCFLLPLAPAPDEDAATAMPARDGRPEYYDFDLFRAGDETRELDERPLADLSYTVFDTETTGLDPAQGDEIIQIGAARIVNGRLLRHERFEQLVDPQRSIPAEGMQIHGITPEMVAGQPVIGEVLPAFHRFASDTILVAHNAAFDMRFLQLKEEGAGVRFEQPVLDTLLLSAVTSPHEASHALEAIAQRFDIPVVGRHTALGDALLTAEVFLRLIPLLAGKGIHTLGQAREAARRTWHARVTY